MEWVKLLCEQVHLFGGMFEILVGFVCCSIHYVAVHCLSHSLSLCSRDRYGRKSHAHRTQVHVPLYHYWGVGVDVMRVICEEWLVGLCICEYLGTFVFFLINE